MSTEGSTTPTTESPAPGLPVSEAATSDASPRVGMVDLGDFDRDDPISRKFGFDRGMCIDRFYIERFLAQHASDIRGRVLEVADNAYTKQFGGARVTQSDILHAQPGHRHATIVGDLTKPEDFPAAAFDCVILTQTLQHVYEVRRALATVRHTLRPGGVALCTVPGISQISRYDMDRWGDFWRFTTLSLRCLCEDAFPGDDHQIRAWGNVRAATAFLHGLCVADVGETGLLNADEDYQMLLTARLCKSGASV